MKRSKAPALLTSVHPAAQHRSNSWQMKSVPVDMIKVSNNPVKPASARAVALCKGHMLGGRQPRPLVVSDDLELIEGLEFLIAAKELGWSHIDVAPLSDLTPNDIRILRIALAKLPYLSDRDEEALSYDLQEIIKFDTDLIDLTGFVMGEIDEVIDPQPSEEEFNPLDELPDAPGRFRGFRGTISAEPPTSERQYLQTKVAEYRQKIARVSVCYY